MRCIHILALAAFCVSTLAARADTFQTFDLNVSFLGAGSITGTVNLDLSSTSTHNLSSSTANLTYINGATTVLFTGNNTSLGETFNTPYTVFLTFFDSSKKDEFVLEVPVTTEGSLAGFAGGVCTGLAGNCGSFDASITIGSSGLNAFRGTFTPDTPASPAPEPASLALLGTGLLGLAEPIRRRWRNAA
jgi:hypothetical protein